MNAVCILRDEGFTVDDLKTEAIQTKVGEVWQARLTINRGDGTVPRRWEGYGFDEDTAIQAAAAHAIPFEVGVIDGR